MKNKVVRMYVLKRALFARYRKKEYLKKCYTCGKEFEEGDIIVSLRGRRNAKLRCLSCAKRIGIL